MKIKKKRTPKGVSPETDSPLDRARIAKMKKMEENLAAGITEKKKNLYELWEAQKTSLRRSIDAKCYDCCGMEYHRNRVKFCHIFTCPLWNVRRNANNVTKEECLEFLEV